MTHSRRSNNKIDRIRERPLRIVYRGFSTSFGGSLPKNKSVTIHNQNLQQLAIKIFKVKMGISPITKRQRENFTILVTTTITTYGVPLI